ncbi:hypothetical protein C8R44DRAFT_989427 [Mycena epipterygia]|nr:hypothetical protein C8R44DRAFT_989427 [Mycena epipterygia]
MRKVSLFPPTFSNVVVSTAFDSDAATSCISLAWILDAGRHMHTSNSCATGLVTLPYDGGVISMTMDILVASSLSHDLLLGMDWYEFKLCACYVHRLLTCTAALPRGYRWNPFGLALIDAPLIDAPISSPHSRSHVAAIVGGALGGVLVAALSLGIFITWWRKTHENSGTPWFLLKDKSNAAIISPFFADSEAEGGLRGANFRDFTGAVPNAYAATPSGTAASTSQPEQTASMTERIVPTKWERLLEKRVVLLEAQIPNRRPPPYSQ